MDCQAYCIQLRREATPLLQTHTTAVMTWISSCGCRNCYGGPHFVPKLGSANFGDDLRDDFGNNFGDDLQWRLVAELPIHLRFQVTMFSLLLNSFGLWHQKIIPSIHPHSMAGWWRFPDVLHCHDGKADCSDVLYIFSVRMSVYHALTKLFFIGWRVSVNNGIQTVGQIFVTYLM